MVSKKNPAGGILTLLSAFFIGFIFQNCYPSWIQSLPDREYKENASVKGIWEKRTNARSAMNSSFHKNIWTERIEFDVPVAGEFRKTYEKKDIFGEKIFEKKVTGFGKYQVKGNWVLLLTTELQTEEMESGIIPNRKIENYHYPLLYHYDKETLTIIPMIYDTAYERKNFGVKDGVDIPYNEDKNFLIYRKAYLQKEFQSHAYYLKRSE